MIAVLPVSFPSDCRKARIQVKDELLVPLAEGSEALNN